MGRKSIMVLLSAILLFGAAPCSFAAKVPELPKLEMPSLSKDYDEMLDELKQEGFGKSRWDSNQPLPLPQVEAPAGTGQSAHQLFTEVYGNLWDSPDHQLDSSPLVPDGIDKELEKYRLQLSSIISARNASEKSKLKRQMSSSLKNRVNQWDLSGVKDGISAKQWSEEDMKSFFDSARKPESFEEIRQKSYEEIEISDIGDDAIQAEESNELKIEDIPEVKWWESLLYDIGIKENVSERQVEANKNSMAIAELNREAVYLKTVAEKERDANGKASDETLKRLNEIYEELKERKGKENWYQAMIRAEKVFRGLW